MAIMPMNEKKELMEALLSESVLARLGTTNPETLQPHIVPVWFLWDGKSVWISAFSSTRKVKDIKRNQRCAVLIEPQGGASELQAVLFEGVAEVILEPRSLVQEMARLIYTKYLGPEGVMSEDPQSWIVDDENTIIKLTPQHTYIW